MHKIKNLKFKILNRVDFYDQIYVNHIISGYTACFQKKKVNARVFEESLFYYFCKFTSLLLAIVFYPFFLYLTRSRIGSLPCANDNIFIKSFYESVTRSYSQSKNLGFILRHIKYLQCLRFCIHEMLYGIIIRFLGYRVVFITDCAYQKRIFIHFFLGKSMSRKVFVSQNFCIFNYTKAGLFSPSKRLLERLKSTVNDIKVIDYFEKRFSGEATYSDVNLASQNKSNFSFTAETAVFLQIFGDAPFSYRFSRHKKNTNLKEYLTELFKTDTLIVIKPHPAASRWGENNMCNLIRYVEDLPTHFIIGNKISNFDIIKNCKSVNTFNGTVYLEALALGVSARKEIFSHFENNFPIANEYFYNEPARVPPELRQSAMRQIYLQEKLLSFSELVRLPLRNRGKNNTGYISNYEIHLKNISQVSQKANILRHFGTQLASGLSNTHMDQL